MIITELNMQRASYAMLKKNEGKKILMK